MQYYPNYPDPVPSPSDGWLAYYSTTAPGTYVKSTRWGTRGSQRGLIAGFNGVPYVGTPEQVVEKMVAISKAGIDGSALHWVDYEAGIDYFNQRVLPLMIQAGLRKR